MAATKNLPQPPSARNFSEAPGYSEITIPRSGVVTLFGYGIKAVVERGHLLLEGGIGAERQRVRLARVGHRLKRLVVIGSDGIISLAALRWLADQGAAFIMLERDGKVLATTGPVRPSDARLRRCQAFASQTGADLVIASEIISRKLAGQEQVAREELHASEIAEQVAGYRLDLAEAETMDAIRALEARGAAAYWSAWRDVPVIFPTKDLPRVPENWRTFGTRKSLLTGSQRLATNPPNACLNYLYSILQAESDLAATALGLDPGLGFIHHDAQARNSFSCDAMEAVRPKVDAYVLRLFRQPLSRNYFFEQRNGNCRLMADFAAYLAQTAPLWAREISPLTEWIARTLWAGRRRAPSEAGIPTRLTQQRKREAKGKPRQMPEVHAPQPQKICRDCGKSLSKDATRCAKCELELSIERLVAVAKIGRLAAHGGDAAVKRGSSQRKQLAARRAWKATEHNTTTTRDQYFERVYPIIRALPNLTIARCIGVSVGYAGKIRKGYLPHPRHWEKLARLAVVS